MNDTPASAPATRELSRDLFVGPQLETQQLAGLKAKGFASVINNRPDNEGGAGQVSSAELETAARAAGLEYRHLPVTPQNHSDADANAMRELVQSLPKPIYAFCRTGNRAEALYRKGQQQS